MSRPTVREVERHFNIRKPVFLGYAIFWRDQEFQCSNQTVTKDTLYLKAHFLGKHNQIPMKWLDMRKNFPVFRFREHQDEIKQLWARRDKRFTLRRVYAH